MFVGLKSDTKSMFNSMVAGHFHSRYVADHLWLAMGSLHYMCRNGVNRCLLVEFKDSNYREDIGKDGSPTNLISISGLIVMGECSVGSLWSGGTRAC